MSGAGESKVFISVEQGLFDVDAADESLSEIIPRIRSVHCIINFGKQRLATPPVQGLNELNWSAFEFEFVLADSAALLSIELHAQLNPPVDADGSAQESDDESVQLCTWSETLRVVEQGIFERWVVMFQNPQYSSAAAEVQLCRMKLYLRIVGSFSPESVCMDDFSKMASIGEGAFGQVLTVRRNTTGKVYAMKVIDKRKVKSRAQLSRMLGERNILMKVQSPFIVGLHWAFQTTDKVCLVLDFIGGGDLFYHLRKYKKFPEPTVRFWAAEIITALDCLHKQSIVYRDLKPENVLLEPGGHVVLVDFGLSKQMEHCSHGGIEGRSNSFVGTPEYLAPEVVRGTGHSVCVDWWTLGVLLFELLMGKPPFKAKDLSILYQQIVAENVVLPKKVSLQDVSQEARSCLRSLLSRDPASRLGAAGPAEVRAHPFFEKLDWALIESKKMPPPYTPVSTAEHLQQVFDMVKSDDAPLEAANAESSKSSENQASATPAAFNMSGTSGTEPVPNYLEGVCDLIEKWQERILQQSGMELALTDDPTETTGSDGCSASSSVDSKSSAGTSKAGTLKVPAAMSDILFGPEVAEMEVMLREMQQRLETQQQTIKHQNKELCLAKAQVELLQSSSTTTSSSTTSSNHDGSAGENSGQTAIVMEENKSLVALTNKMATVLATNVGPVGDQIVDILSEAQKLIGLARTEQTSVRDQVDNGLLGSPNWKQMVEIQTSSLLKEQLAKDEIGKMAQALSETEDRYMKAIVESQQTVATAALERDALLQLASKLEEQTRVQSDRENQFMNALSETGHKLESTQQQLEQSQHAELQLRDERNVLLAMVEKHLGPEQAQALNASVAADDSKQSSWPNPIKWMMGKGKQGSDSRKNETDSD